ncbi:MAG: hypothetical protein ACMUIP_09435 [bacterium]
MERALISVSNKEGIVEFAQGLKRHGIEILSTGGTARLLKEKGVAVSDVSSYTGHPEMLDGRVKTLHPKIHAGLLARRDKPEHMEQLKKYNYPIIDMVVVNLYPFEQTIARDGSTFEDAIENIDIGGPTMLRSAAKNFEYIVVVVSPDDYSVILEKMDRQDGYIDRETRFSLMKKVFEHTAHYDRAIRQYLDTIA